MPNDNVYVPASPGDVITAEAWNAMQGEIHDDIRKTAREAAAAVTQVERAGDAETLDGKTPDQLAQTIADKVLALLQEKRSYLKLFKVLTVDETKILKHGFGDCPVVDVYQLDSFKVVCAEDDGVYPTWTTFYAYHAATERRVRYPRGEDYGAGQLDIEPKSPPVHRIPFHVLLDRYKVEYTSTTSLGDLETELWQALLSPPNDEFDEEQYCHSPWFQRCCREEKTVRHLKESGDWDEMYIQMRPRKTINLQGTTRAPTEIQVTQIDLDSVGITLLASSQQPIGGEIVKPTTPTGTPNLVERAGAILNNELNVMVILKS